MGLAKPTGGYAGQMLDPGGWPDVDEQVFYDRAQEYTQVLRQATDVMEASQSRRAEIFDGGTWSGSAAGAANGEFGTLLDQMVTLQNGLATVITWHKYVAQVVVQAKSDITDNVVEAHRTINALETDTSLDDAERNQQIEAVVNATHGANESIVDGTAAQVLVSKAWKPPANALQDLLDQKTPPPVVMPDGPTGPPSPRPRPAPQVPVMPGTGGPKPPRMPGTGQLTPPATPGTGGLTPTTPPLDGGGLLPNNPPAAGPAGPRPLTPVGPSPAVPGSGPSAPLGPAAPAVPLSPAAGGAQPGGGAAGGKGVTPAAASGPGVAPASVTPGEESAAGAQAGGSGVPTAPMGAGGAGGGSGSGARSGGPVGQKPADKSASTQPAASARPSSKSKPRAQPTHADRAEIAEAVVAAPAVAIPVSAARLERDAVAEAAKADAARRAGPDALQLARRIGAALNAADSGGGMDLGFFWVTGVTTDGLIVVANSFGLAYIPEEVQLPPKVYLASGDETIPAAERARWATYPVMAVRGWAEHHEKELRAVIGTEEQLANSDAGVAKIVLERDDIPDTGEMVGRSRLEVVDPEAAELLATTPHERLVDLLPPAPVGAEPAPEPAREPQPEPAAVVEPEAAAVLVAPGAGPMRMGELLAQMPLPEAVADAPDAPADDRFLLWFEVMKPLASDAPGRQAAHLLAFQTYAAHAEEVLLREAHTADDLVIQRNAVADWMYWKYLAGLLSDALADPRLLSPA
ncbi:secretion protein EspK [Mycobacterium sp. Aquia_216]|uniref:secretion protein EspK n=1 Tax=Mycobacterium sp. Aquia_216 TaxID=2991729 RepID=UPI00227A32D0|nr:secretion protein EspK [Mycobacterium sp. Aquia_216]WAJ45183.1 secretion protein EspK [Mycobacterium sp. Aquia_216]